MADIVRFGAEFDSRNMVRGIRDADNRLRGLNRTAKKSTSAINAMKAALVGFLSIYAARRLAGLAKELFTLGAAAAATSNRFAVTFGTATASIEEFRNEWGRISGLSTREFEDLASRGAAVTQGMGAAAQASADFSEQILRLGGDLASFNDLPTAQAVDAIIAALTGENEKLKRFNIIVNEASTNLRAMANTGKTTAAELTLLDKATAKLELITGFAGVAMGDLERTAQDIDNVVKQLSAAWASFNDQLGSFLADSPLIKKVLEEIRSLLYDMTDVLASGGPIIGEAFELLGSIAANAFSGAVLSGLRGLDQKIADELGILGDVIQFVTQDTKELDALIDAAGENVRAGVEALHNLAAGARAFADANKAYAARTLVGPPSTLNPNYVPPSEQRGGGSGTVGTGGPATRLAGLSSLGSFGGLPIDALNRMADAAQRANRIFAETEPQMVGQWAAMNRFADAIKNVGAATDETASEFDDIAAQGFRGMTGALEDFIGTGLKGFADLGDAISQMLQGLAAQALTQKAGQALGILSLQSGGVVPGPIGAPVPAIVHGGETVIPANQSAGTVVNQNINFNVSAADGQSVAQFFAANKGEIAKVVAEAADQSSAFRRRLGR
jgi:hypothetical protein